MLTNLGLAELIADDQDAYVELAVRLASDLPRLSNLRAGLRERMRRSPNTDGAACARNLEAAYRRIWNSWRAPEHR